MICLERRDTDKTEKNTSGQHPRHRLHWLAAARRAGLGHGAVRQHRQRRTSGGPISPAAQTSPPAFIGGNRSRTTGTKYSDRVRQLTAITQRGFGQQRLRGHRRIFWQGPEKTGAFRRKTIETTRSRSKSSRRALLPRHVQQGLSTGGTWSITEFTSNHFFKPCRTWSILSRQPDRVSSSSAYEAECNGRRRKRPAPRSEGRRRTRPPAGG